MSFWVIAGTTLVSAGTAVYSSAQTKKAGKKQAGALRDSSAAQLKYMQQRATERAAMLQKMIKDGTFEFPEVDVGAATDQALAITTRNLPGIVANTKTAYDAAAANFRDFLKTSFGKTDEGKDVIDEMTGGASDVVQSQLMGRLAPGTRRLLGRQALATGRAASLGQGAVQDAYTYQLGITAEQQSQAGVQNYQNLYTTYGRFAPQITPLNLLPYGGLTTGESITNAQFNAKGEWESQLGEAQAILGGYDTETGQVGSLIGPSIMGAAAPGIASALGNAQLGEQIGKAAAGIGGMYAGITLLRNPNALYQTGSQGGAPVYAENSLGSLNRNALPSTYYLGETEVRRAIPLENTGLGFGRLGYGFNSGNSNPYAQAAAMRVLMG